jgi:carbon monoxide dehydrogenase subunit G
VFRIKANYSEQLEIKTSLERAREFFGELRNFAELMPGVEGIKAEANGLMRWMIRADVPVLGSMRAAFVVERTEDKPQRLEWSPARVEKQNYLRYAATFEERGAKTLVRIVQHVEMRRQHAKELHLLAGLVGEGRISAEMQKRVAEMIKTFLQRAQLKLETGAAN